MSAAPIGLIEAGGTKFVLGIADASGKIGERMRLPTTTPDETLGAAIAWFASRAVKPHALGIAAFGPLDLDPASPTYGCLRATTKPHWSGAAIARPFAAALGIPVALDTDVNGAALAEARWGAGSKTHGGVGHASLLYLTIGTGVGGGFVSRGELLRGVSHPEMGHILVPRHADDGDFGGVCPFHRDCLEGMASGPAIEARWGQSLSELPADHPAHARIAWYLGRAMVTYQAIMEPARIVLGGGVMNTPGLLERVREVAVQAGGGYFVGDPHSVIITPALGADAGLLGALALVLRSTS